MSDRSIIEGRLREVAGRWRRQRAWQWGWRGWLWGAVVWCAWVGVHRVLPISDTGVAWGWWGMVAGGLTGAIVGWWRSWDLMEAARWLEAREELPQALSTAVEMFQDPKASPAWRDLVAGRAAEEAGKVTLGRVLPWRLPVAARWTGVLLMAVWFLGWVPVYRSPSWVRSEKETERVAETGRRLAQLAERTLAQQPPEDERLRELLEEVRWTGERLADDPMSRMEAVQALSRVTDRFREEARALAEASALDSLQRSARRPSDRGRASGHREGPPSETAGAMEAREAEEALSGRRDRAREPAMGGPSTPGLAAGSPAMEESLEGLPGTAEESGGMGNGLQERMEGMEGEEGLERGAEPGQAWAAWAERLEQGLLAVRNGAMWQVGTEDGTRSGGGGQEGNPGLGAGQGVEEGRLFYPENTGLGGGVGGRQPGVASSEIKDGGEELLTGTAVPSRVQGALTPGPMPSVALKGSSLRGQSTVGYREAVVAAQMEAERALNQDTVPRAYRNSVRGYFDDLE
jgi:hypothetical protein